MKGEFEFAKTLAKVLGLEDREDTKWGPLTALTDRQQDIVAEFHNKGALLQAEFEQRDNKLKSDYLRQMNGGVGGADRDFQIIQVDGRKYVRWEIPS